MQMNNEMNNKLMERLMGKCVAEVVEACASMYSFSAEECLKVLLQNPMKPSKPKATKSEKAKSIPLPFMREHVNESGCQGIIFNHGLFTQCRNERSEQLMCSTCLETNCGTVEARLSADFKDPKGRKPTSYIAVLRKLKLTQEDAMEEAGKNNIELNESHFVEQVKPVKEKVVKEPKVKVVKEPKVKVVKEVKEVKEKVEKPIKVKEVKEKVEKPVKEKVVKEKVVKEKVVKEKVVKEKVGRPKSTKKAIETVTVEDLFASLVAEELSDNEDQQEVTTVSVVAEVQVQTKEQKKAESAAERSTERSEREQMKAAEMEQKKYEAELKKAADKENKAAAAALVKEAKAAAAAELAAVAEAAKKDKEEKAAAAKKEKEEKAAALALEKEQKAAALAAAKQEKEAALALAKQEKEAALAAAKKEKEEKAALAAAAAAEKKAGKGKTVVAAVSEPVVVEAAPVKVTVKRITIEGKEYLKSSTNMLYDPETKDEVGIWNPVTETIDELPEESDDEEVEDDYESGSD